MMKNLIVIAKQISACALIFLPCTTLFSQIVAHTYSYTGSVQAFTVPACVLTLTIEAEGAQGNYNSSFTTPGGYGGYLSGVLAVTPGQVLSVFVGGMTGYNGGGNPGSSPCVAAKGGMGGGASDIRINGIGLNNRILVAGGGGGAGGSRATGCGRGTGGGGGGGYFGGGGGSGFPQSSTVVPTGGNQYAGGIGGTSTFSATQNGTAGFLGHGGNGGGETSSNQNSTHAASQGGSGGGLFGSSGQQPSTNYFTGQSGAGGSSRSDGLTNVVTQAGTNQGDGQITIFYSIQQPVAVSASNTLICISSSVAITTASNLVNYFWSDSSITQNIVVTPGITTTYSLSGTNASGCAVAGSITIEVNQGVPVISVAGSTSVVCPNHTVVLTAGGAQGSYAWSGNITNNVAFTPTATTSYTVSNANACGTGTAVSTVSVTMLPIGITITPAHICEGATATLSGNGASTYTWLAGFQPQFGTPNAFAGTNLVLTPTAGETYTLVGKTSACSGTTAITLQVDPNPVITVSATRSVICTGDSVVLNVNGALSYTWANGGPANAPALVSPSVSTLFSVTGTNSLNCSSEGYQPVLVNSLPSVGVTASDLIVCSGGASTLFATGANTYTWNSIAGASSKVVNPIVTGNYNVTGSDANGCRNTAVITLNVFIPNVGVTSNASICSGDDVMIGAFGADSYTWSTGEVMPYITVSPAASTVYTLSAMVDNNNGLSCSVSNTVSVMVNAIPEVTVSNTNTVICRGSSVMLDGAGAVTYTWSGQSVNHVNASFITVSPVYNQTYSVTGTDANGCVGTAIFQLRVTACTGIAAYSAGHELSVYPNPSSGEFTIGARQFKSFVIADQTGREVRSIALNEGEQEIKVNDLDSGIYFITAKSDDSSVKQKIIITR